MVTGAFDNSPGNSAIPDPGARVHLGLQSWEEMFVGFFEAADEPGPEREDAANAANGKL